MKLLIITFGSQGDVQPYVALGLGLKSAGHSVTICTCSSFEPLITRHGLEYAYAANDLMDLMDSSEGRAAMEGARGLVGTIRVAARLMKDAKVINYRLLEDSWAAAQAVDPDMVIFHPKALGGVSVAERLGIPAVMALPFPMIVPTAEVPTIGFPSLGIGGWYNRFTYKLVQMGYRMYARQVDEFRRERLGLGRLPKAAGILYSANGQPVPVLHCYSSQVVPRPGDWPSHAQVTGYWFLDRPREWRPAPELEAFLEQGEAPVYIGFGSMAGRHPEKMAGIVVDALQKTGLRGVIATGRGGLKVDAVPDTLLCIDGAPHDYLFPRMSAVVHHGGAGTTAAGLRAGRPTVVCPFGGDQPFWGRRVYELGVGSRPIPQKKLSVDNLVQALRTVTGKGNISDTAEALGERIRSEAGVANAVAAIEAIHQRHKR